MASLLLAVLLIGVLIVCVHQLHQLNQRLVGRINDLQAAPGPASSSLATVAHELRNPLSAVIGFSELMQDGRLGPLTDRQNEPVGIIRESAEHALALVEDLLDVSGIAAGRLRLEPAPVEPAIILKGCVRSLEQQAVRRGVAVELDAPRRGPVLVDPTRLRQVVLNLLSNAIKFTPEGGRVAVSLHREPSGLGVEVTDSGPGIGSADQARVFESFVRLGGTEPAGTGLGLAVTKHLVEAQGGVIELHSQLGQGSTFSVRLPAPEPPAICDPLDLDRDPEIRIYSPAASARA
jgi:signal transduction histidine kinase